MDTRKLICSSAALLERGVGIRFEVDEDGESTPAFIVRYKGRAYAYLNRCAHMGLELDILPGHFFTGSGDFLICATHAATYDPESGRCKGGPCKGAGLERLTIVEQDGRIEIVGRALAGRTDPDTGCEV